MCEQKRDYNLLRPFDLEEAKKGAPLCYVYSDSTVDYIAGPDAAEQIACKTKKNRIYTDSITSFRMAPLCWVEGRPVYKGDILRNKFAPAFVYIADRVEGDVLISNGLTTGNREEVINLTWTPSPVKREGWVNIYPILFEGLVASVSNAHASKDSADRNACAGRIACVRIEWEE